jgi:uncharacterized protein YegP (UPF0339 family)
MIFYIFEGRDGFWHWQLKTTEGRKIVESNENYVDKDTCLSAITLIQSSIVAEVVSLG